jgi:hypothetical protein
MKYKRLSAEELSHLEKEFVSFLAHAQITAHDWEKMKREENNKANELIDVFSDVVYDKVLKKIKFLEYRDSKTLNIFKFSDTIIELAGIRVNALSEIDLTKTQNFNDINSFSGVSIVHSQKKYSKEKELEIFEMLESGCLITDEKLFNLLQGIKK